MDMKRSLAIFLLFALVFAFGCQTAPTADEKGPITVASFIDAEGAILGKMIVLLLEADGFKVNDRTEFGTPDVLRNAILADELDLVLDYTGSGQFYFESDDDDVWSDPVLGYESTKTMDREQNQLVWLTPANANNTEVIATTRAFAEANGLVDMYDFAEYVNNGGTVKLILAAGFAENPRGLLGYEEAYGFTLTNQQLIILSSGNTAEMLKALYEGTNDVNFSLAYGTDGALDQMDLVVLADPENVPPVYLPCPVLREELYLEYPEIETILKPLFESFTKEVLQQLNAQVAFEGASATDTARNYLIENGFLDQ
jgi:osmoprotectant transport system substrate-binding protein